MQNDSTKERMNENLINQIISNPIHIYNVIKEILLFEETVFPLLLETASDNGIYFEGFTVTLDMLGNPTQGVKFIFFGLGWETSVMPMIGKHMNKGMELPTKNDLLGATFSLWILPLTYRFHPIELVDGKLKGHVTNARLDFDDIIHISQECFSSTKSLFLDTHRSYFKKAESNYIHYAVAIEWMEAAEL